LAVVGKRAGGRVWQIGFHRFSRDQFTAAILSLNRSLILKTNTNQNKPAWRCSPSRIKATLFCLMAAATFALSLDSTAGTVTNLAPVAANEVVQRNQDYGLRMRATTLLANDTVPGNDHLKLVSVGATSAAGGTVVTRGKWISYNPPPGFTNSDSFSYVIANSSGLTATGSVSITIRADLDPPQNIAVREVLANGDSRLQFFGIPGRIYTIHYAESLQAPHWRPLGKRLADATGKFEFTDPAAPNSPARFYRSTNP
jgi:hypothetical protein